MKFETVISPRFSDTDALGHISNTTMPCWFEYARKPIFELIHPRLTLTDWPMIVAHIDVDYLRQIFHDADVTLKTGIKKIGEKSITMYHEAWQHQQKAASGHAVMVFFDYQQQCTVRVPDEVRERLQPALMDQ